MNICIVVGARPNFVKAAPIIRAVQAARQKGEVINGELVFAGSEDDKSIESSLFDDLMMPHPDIYLGADSDNLNELTGMVMSKFEQYLDQHPTDVVIVVDDLASTMAASIVAKKRGLLLAHLVAGTRSFDITMPKEVNRLVIDGLSDLLFTAGVSGNSTATREGAGQEKIYMVGNILIDSLRHNRQRMVRSAILDRLGLADGSYLVFTLNRHALISDTSNLRAMLHSVINAAGQTHVIAPLRGQAAQAVKSILAEEPCTSAHFHVTDAMSYLEFGYLSAHAKGIITDSGNVAEEATFNSVPCITLNSYTEHAETVRQGTNVLVGENADILGEKTSEMVRGKWKNSTLPDRWDGRSAERIVQILTDVYAARH